MDLFSTALPALGEAFALILQPQQIMFLILGVLLGLSVGVFPGLGGIAGLSMVLPFIYGMDPVSGLALMVGLVAVIPTSDTFASVLMGIPGSSASQATVLDGFPLAKKGEAARALSAAFASSLFGGLFGRDHPDILHPDRASPGAGIRPARDADDHDPRPVHGGDSGRPHADKGVAAAGSV